MLDEQLHILISKKEKKKLKKKAKKAGLSLSQYCRLILENKL